MLPTGAGPPHSLSALLDGLLEHVIAQHGAVLRPVVDGDEGGARRRALLLTEQAILKHVVNCIADQLPGRCGGRVGGIGKEARPCYR